MSAPEKSAPAVKESKKKAPPSFWHNLFVPAWLAPAFKNKRTIKTYIRCLLVLTSMLVLMVDNTTLKTMGQAGFFGVIISFMIPPSMAGPMFLLAATTLVVGMCMGWAWGCAAMAASLRARSQTVLASAYTNAESKLIPGVAPDAQFQQFVFQGDFLDPRSSAVYGVFFFIGTFTLGILRASIPRLTLTAIFGTIVLDVMCSYGPLFPTSQYTLATMFLIPTSFYLAIAIASLILVFPESMNHGWLNLLTTSVFTPCLNILELQARAVSAETTDPEDWKALLEEGRGHGKTLIAGAQGVMGQTNLVDLEVSRGKLGAGDLKHLSEQLRELSSRSVGLLSFLTLVDEVSSIDAAANGESDGAVTPQSVSRFAAVRARIKEREERHGHTLEALKPALLESSAALREACETALKGRTTWLDAINSGRWSFKSNNAEEDAKALAEAQAQVQAVRDALAQFRTVERLKLLVPFERYFDPATGDLLPDYTPRIPNRMFTAQSLFICFVFVTTLEAYALTLLKVLDFLVDLQKKRTRNRLWFPTGFGSLGRKLRARSREDNALAMGPPIDTSEPQVVDEGDDDDEDEDEDEEDEKKGKKEKKSPALDPDAGPPRTALGRMHGRYAALLHWFTSTEATFALRYSVVSLCLWVLSVHPTTAYFTYSNRGLWALIMSQTGLGLYAGEQISAFIIRILGTAIGLLIGTCAWYIGAGGLGSGNPYGVVIITLVLVSPFLFARVAAPQAEMVLWLMTGVMTVFVVGYSWIDTHLPALANPGVGVNVAWRRAVTVMIGFTAAFIVMLFPKPTSARQVVRRTLASTTEQLGNVLAAEIDACITESHSSLQGGKWTKEKDRRVRKAGAKLLGITQQLQWVTPSMSTALFEPTFKGPWPSDKYHRLMDSQWKFIASLALLNGALHELDAKWLHVLVHKTPFLNPNLLADIFAVVHIVARSLRHAHPLPSTLVPLSDRLIYHERHSAMFAGPESERPTALKEELESGADKIDGASIGLSLITMRELRDEQLVFHSTAVMALASIIRAMDNITDITRELCGTETAYPSFDVLRTEYLGMEEATIRQLVEKRV